MKNLYEYISESCSISLNEAISMLSDYKIANTEGFIQCILPVCNIGQKKMPDYYNKSLITKALEHKFSDHFTLVYIANDCVHMWVDGQCYCFDNHKKEWSIDDSVETLEDELNFSFNLREVVRAHRDCRWLKEV